MKKLALICSAVALFSLVGFTGYYYSGTGNATDATKSRFAALTEQDKAEIIASVNSGDCSWNGIKLYGKVQFVTSFPDVKIQYVESFPDIKVQWVTSFPDDCGEWQEVTSFPDFKVQVVTSFPDVKVQEVTSFPGM